MSGVSGIGAVGGMGGMGAVSGGAAVGPAAAPAAGSVDAGPSSVVSLGASSNGPSLTGAAGAGAYGAVASLGTSSSMTTVSTFGINVSNISAQTGFSSDFVHGFMAGYVVAAGGRDPLTEALILALLLKHLNDR